MSCANAKIQSRTIRTERRCAIDDCALRKIHSRNGLRDWLFLNARNRRKRTARTPEQSLRPRRMRPFRGLHTYPHFAVQEAGGSHERK